MSGHRSSSRNARRTEKLSEYLDGRLTPKARRALERQVDHDAELRALLADLRSVRQRIAADPLPEPPAAMLPRVLARVGTARRAPTVPRWAITGSIAVLLLATLLNLPYLPRASSDLAVDAQFEYHSVLIRVLNPIIDLIPVVTPRPLEEVNGSPQ